MSKFFALKMAEEVANHPRLATQDRFFGLMRDVVYKPTDSKLASFSNFYKDTDAQLFKNLIECTSDQLDSKVDLLKDAYCTPDSSFRLDICVSEDGRFIAMQLNHVADNVTTHITPIRYFEGEEAQKVDQIF